MSMEKITVSSVGEPCVPESCVMISQRTPDYLVGRICTLIETLGLRDSQEKAVKDLAKQEIYNLLAGLDRDYISPQLASVIRSVYLKALEEANKEGVPLDNFADFELTFIPKN